MVSNKQRRRQLARAKWERQRTRREAHATRSRRFQVVVGAIVGVIAVAALVWVVVWVVQEEDERTPDQVVPTNGERPTFISPPAETEPTTAPPRTDGTATSTQGTTR